MTTTESPTETPTGTPTGTPTPTAPPLPEGVLADVLTAARIGLDPGDGALAVDPASATRALVRIERGAADLDAVLAEALSDVLARLDVPAVVLLRRPGGRPLPVDREAWALLRRRLPPAVLLAGLVVGDRRAWSLDDDAAVPEPAPGGLPRAS